MGRRERLRARRGLEQSFRDLGVNLLSFGQRPSEVAISFINKLLWDCSRLPSFPFASNEKLNLPLKHSSSAILMQAREDLNG